MEEIDEETKEAEYKMNWRKIRVKGEYTDGMKKRERKNDHRYRF